MVLLVRFGDRRCHGFEGREDRQLLSVGVPLQHLIEEPETLDRGLQAGLAPGRVECRRVDELHVLPERVVDGQHRIDRTRHDISPQC